MILGHRRLELHEKSIDPHHCPVSGNRAVTRKILADGDVGIARGKRRPHPKGGGIAGIQER